MLALEKSLRLLAAADLSRIFGRTLQYHVTSKTDDPALGSGELMACCVSSFHLYKLPTLQPTITVTHELQTACMQAPLFRDMQNMPSACFPSHVLTQLLKNWNAANGLFSVGRTRRNQTLPHATEARSSSTQDICSQTTLHTHAWRTVYGSCAT